MWKVNFLHSAQDDLDQIIAWIANESGSVEIALDFADTLAERCAAIGAQDFKQGRFCPELGAGLYQINQVNYLIFVRYHDDRMDVVNILEGHRDIGALFEAD